VIDLKLEEDEAKCSGDPREIALVDKKKKKLGPLRGPTTSRSSPKSIEVIDDGWKPLNRH
jgi:hypothetical protein